jgi:hypothetical protein
MSNLNDPPGGINGIITDAENKQNAVIYVCVSGARSARLVLDL